MEGGTIQLFPSSACFFFFHFPSRSWHRISSSLEGVEGEGGGIGEGGAGGGGGEGRACPPSSSDPSS